MTYIYLILLIAMPAWGQGQKGDMMRPTEFILLRDAAWRLLSEYSTAQRVLSDTELGQLSWVEVATDSVVWRTTAVDSANPGIDTCAHDWVYSETQRAGGDVMCLVMHNGAHCDYDDLTRERICRVCLRHEHQFEQWYQHREAPPMSAFDSLKAKLKVRP